ncbi:MAG: hypothetical protein H6Q17_742 [Bacteroidetes bacterium]|nr:hypothetical protein [Bacteroidota bacterium]
MHSLFLIGYGNRSTKERYKYTTIELPHPKKELQENINSWGGKRYKRKDERKSGAEKKVNQRHPLPVEIFLNNPIWYLQKKLYLQKIKTLNNIFD